MVNAKSAGLGERFVISFEKAVAKLIKNPEHYMYITQNVRRCTINQFPYNIHYTQKGNTIIILGVIHRKRSNAFLHRRFK